MVVDPCQLQLDIKPTESIIIRDSNTKEVVGVMIRQFGGNNELVEWAGQVALQSTQYTKSERRPIATFRLRVTVCGPLVGVLLGCI